MDVKGGAVHSKFIVVFLAILGVSCTAPDFSNTSTTISGHSDLVCIRIKFTSSSALIGNEIPES